MYSYTPVTSSALHSFAQDALQRLNMAVGSGGRAGDVERRGGAPLLRGCLHSSLAASEGEVSALHQHHTVSRSRAAAATRSRRCTVPRALAHRNLLMCGCTGARFGQRGTPV